MVRPVGACSDTCHIAGGRASGCEGTSANLDPEPGSPSPLQQESDPAEAGTTHHAAIPVAAHLPVQLPPQPPPATWGVKQWTEDL